MEFIVHQEMVIKLGIAALLGMFIGLERELKRKPLGLKTCIVISLVACLITIVSVESAYQFPKTERIMMDPLRLAAQIVSGIGFIGAGVILRRSNDVISGLTTAAMIWGAGGIGIAVGAGFYEEAVIAVVVLILSVELVPIIMKLLLPPLKTKELKARIVVKENTEMTRLLKEVKSKGVKVKKVKVKDIAREVKEEKKLKTFSTQMDLHMTVHEKRYTTDIYYSIKEIEGVVSVEIESY